MNFQNFQPFRAMRERLRAATRKGRVAVIDVGSSKITCLILALDAARLAKAEEEGRLATDAFGAVEVVGARMVQSRGVRRGEIVDMEEACRAIRLALMTAEKMAAPRVDRVDQVICSFSGGKPRSLSTTGEVEIESGEVASRDISRVLAACPEPPLGEGRTILHAQPVEFTVDYSRGISDPRGMTGRKLSASMHVMTVEAQPLANLMQCIRRCDLDLAGIVCAPYASGLAALVEDEQRTGAVCIDMGGGTTGFSIFLGGQMICADVVRFGGENITRDIAAGLMVRGERAERIKNMNGGAYATGSDDRVMIDAPPIGEEDMPERRQISRSMLIGVIRPRLEEIFEHLRARMEAVGFQDLPGRRVVLTGNAAQLPGLDEMANRLLGRRPRIGKPLRIAGLPQSLTGPGYAAAVGLAIYALRPHDEIWDFEAPPSVGARGRAGEVFRWLKNNW